MDNRTGNLCVRGICHVLTGKDSRMGIERKIAFIVRVFGRTSPCCKDLNVLGNTDPALFIDSPCFLAWT